VNKFEQVAHGRYIIKLGQLDGRWVSQALQGARLVGDRQHGTSREDALKKAQTLLDEREASIISGRGADGSPSAREYAEAFDSLGKLPVSYEAMLEAHLNAPDHSITATELAEAAGYENYNAANLHYGKLGQMLAEQLNYNPPQRDDGTVIWTATLAWPDGDVDLEKLTRFMERRMDDGHFEWIMRPQLVEALRGRR
jgi:hypothetical protein